MKKVSSKIKVYLNNGAIILLSLASMIVLFEVIYMKNGGHSMNSLQNMGKLSFQGIYEGSPQGVLFGVASIIIFTLPILYLSNIVVKYLFGEIGLNWARFLIWIFALFVLATVVSGGETLYHCFGRLGCSEERLNTLIIVGILNIYAIWRINSLWRMAKY